MKRKIAKNIGTACCALVLALLLSGCVAYGGGGYYGPYGYYHPVGVGIGVY